MAAGRVAVVTGANTGIGRATALGLAGLGWRVYVAARSVAKGEAAVARIKAESGSAFVWLLPLDLAVCRRCAPARLLSSRGTSRCTCW